MQPTHTTLNKISYWILAVTGFLFPIFFAPSLLGITQAKVGLLSLAVITVALLFMVDRINTKEFSLRFSMLTIMALLLSLSYLISGIRGVSQYRSLIGNLGGLNTFHGIVITLLFMFFVSSFVNTAKRVRRFITLMIAGSVVAMVTQIVFVFFGHGVWRGAVSQATTLAGSLNDLSILATISLFFVLFVAPERVDNKLKSVLRYVLIVACFFFILLSSVFFDFYFFSVSLPLLVGLILLLVFAFVFSKRISHKDTSVAPEATRSNLSFTPVLTSLVLTLVIVLFGGAITSFLGSKFGINFSEGRPGWEVTTLIDKHILSVKPFFGTGSGSFAFEWNLNKPVDVNSYPFWNTTFGVGVSTITTLLGELGFVGLLLWLVFLYFVVRSLYVFVKTNDPLSKEFKGFLAISTLFLVGTYFFYVPGITPSLLFFALVGLFIGYGDREVFVLNSKNQESTSHTKNFILSLLIIAIFVGLVFWLYKVSTKLFALSNTNMAVVSSDPDYVLKKINLSLRYDSYEPLYYLTASRVAVFKLVDLLKNNAKEAELSSVLNAVVGNARTALAIDPVSFENQIAVAENFAFLGNLGVKGSYEQALSLYQRASLLSPTNPLPLLYMAGVSVSLNDKKTANQYLVKAISLKSNYADSQNVADFIVSLLGKINNTSSDAKQSTATTTKTTKTSK